MSTSKMLTILNRKMSIKMFYSILPGITNIMTSKIIFILD
jgi:hypothetical protein